MTTLSAREEILFRIGKGALPEILFADDTSQQEILAAFAKQLAPVWDEMELRLEEALLGTASSTGLGQHAKDRGTRRQANETDEALIYRLRFMLEDSVTVAGLKAKATAILNSYGVTIPTGYPVLAELRIGSRFRWGYTRDVALTAVAASSLVDGETFTIGGTVYEFNLSGGVTGGNVAVTLSGSETAPQVAAAMFAAMTPQFGTTRMKLLSNNLLVRDVLGLVSDTVTNAGFRIFRKKSYWSRGYRFSGAGRDGTVIVMMLPYGTSEACRLSVAEALRQAKAGGVKVITERRINP
jgi:hypothetical protein